MNTYRCEFSHFEQVGDGYRGVVKLLDDHKVYGGQAGDMCTTSPIHTIDFDKGLIITRNSIYIVKRWRFR